MKTTLEIPDSLMRRDRRCGSRDTERSTSRASKRRSVPAAISVQLVDTNFLAYLMIAGGRTAAA
jgi:hypothetical protein